MYGLKLLFHYLLCEKISSPTRLLIHLYILGQWISEILEFI